MRGAHHQGGVVGPGPGSGSPRDQARQPVDPGDMSAKELNHPVCTVEDLLS